MASRIALIVKGNIRRRNRFSRDLEILREELPDFDITVYESEIAGQAISLSAAASHQFDYVIAVGGDGTINEVLNGIQAARRERSDLVPPVLGILAYGTANDFIRSVGLSGSVRELCSLLRERETRAVDIGRLSCVDREGRQTERYFINAADVGLGAAVMQHFDTGDSRLGADIGYLKALFSTLWRFKALPLELETDGGFRWRGRALIVAVANGRYFGSGLCVAPQAKVDDGLLTMTLVGDASKLDLIRNLGRLRRGQKLHHREVQYLEVRRVRIEAEDKPLYVESDGESLGTTPVEIEVIPSAISLLAPSDPE